MGIEPLKNGDKRSEKLRNFIDKLYSELGLTGKSEFLTSIQSDNPPYERVTNPNDEEKPFQKCIYYSPTENGKVTCQKDFTKKGKIYTLTEEDCLTCWKRRDYVRSRKSVNTSTPLNCKRQLRIFPSGMGVICYQVCKYKHPVVFRECEARKQVESPSKTEKEE